MTVDIIVNNNAGRLRSDTMLRRALLGAAAADRAHARIHQTSSLQALDCVADEIAMRGTDAVVLAGGDGSHMAGVTALSRAFNHALPPVALAPCGTVGTVARNFGTRGTARTWNETLVRAACTGAFRIIHKPTLRICDDHGGKRVGFIFGAGLVARFFDHYYSSSGQGLGAAANIVSRVFVGSFLGWPLAQRILTPTGCSISVDDSPPQGPAWTLVIASVVRDVGLHLLVTYRAGEKEGQFHVVASGLPARSLGPQLLRVLAGRPLEGEPQVDGLARSLRVRFDAEDGAAYVLDGDVFRAREARLESGPRLPLIVPLSSTSSSPS
jgi:diacylglycerol kinase family enzyme